MAKKQLSSIQETIPVELDNEALDIILVDGDYKKVLIDYNLETGDAKVREVVSMGASKNVAVMDGGKYFTQKLLLGRFVQKGSK